jgi:hypothetical protein
VSTRPRPGVHPRESPRDTFLRFKGLERPAVIVTDLPGSRPDGDESLRVRMHIAVSRAQSALRIIGTRPAMLADPVLRERIGAG